MTNDEAVAAALGPHTDENPRRCIWQICPYEMPEGMRTMALELYQTLDGLHLVQLFVPTGHTWKAGDVESPWYHNVEAWEHWTVAPREPRN